MTAVIEWAPAGSFGFTTGLALNLTDLGDAPPLSTPLGLYFGNTVLGGPTFKAVLLDPFFLAYDLRTAVAPRTVAIQAQFAIDQPLLTGSGTFSVVGGADLPTTGVVPEPSTYVLLATGLGALAVVRRRRVAR
ncbi:PEP-CTERM sorting domain-containing protein [Roseisolibacter sp. H3M3-2]|nr:PEP-CTERM sorting domain-containing protein [Roseisolibacter sp. H3M3-2]